MINLLPPTAKHDLAAGRANALLIRYIWISIALFALLAVLCGLTLVMLMNARQSAQDNITSNEKNAADLTLVKQRADTFKSNLDISKSILDQQTHYTDTLLKISSLMTKGTTLSSLSLDETTYGTPITLQVYATSQDAAVALKKSFQDSTLFSDVHFQTLTMGSTSEGGGNKSYPVSAQLIVTINKEAI